MPLGAHAAHTATDTGAPYVLFVVRVCAYALLYGKHSFYMCYVSRRCAVYNIAYMQHIICREALRQETKTFAQHHSLGCAINSLGDIPARHCRALDDGKNGRTPERGIPCAPAARH